MCSDSTLSPTDPQGVIGYMPINPRQQRPTLISASCKTPIRSGKRARGQLYTPPTTVKRARKEEHYPSQISLMKDLGQEHISKCLAIGKPGVNAQGNLLHKAPQIPTYEMKRFTSPRSREDDSANEEISISDSGMDSGSEDAFFAELIAQETTNVSSLGWLDRRIHGDEISSILCESLGGFQNLPFLPTSHEAFVRSSEAPQTMPVKKIGDSDVDLEDFGDDIDISEIVKLTDEVSEDARICPQSTLRGSTPKLQWNSPRYYDPTQKSGTSLSKVAPLSFQTVEPANRGFNTSQSQFPSSHITKSNALSPVSSTISRISVPQTPFVRPQLPSPVKDRSPVLGLSNRSPLVTQFRLGAAINHAALVARSFSSLDSLIELYGRVIESTRDGPRQLFKFADLFHTDKPPFLEGVWVGWKNMPYWEQDASAFLGDQAKGKICRAVGRIQKEHKQNWRMCIVSLWEASWDDIEAVQGIICI